jgi:hypothetical protein
MRHTPLLAVALLAATAAPAQAAFFPADPVDGPSASIGAPDVDLARDGTGAIAYTRGGAAVVSRLVRGVPQGPEVLGPGSQVAVAASDNGRVVVVFSGGGTVFAAVRPAADQPFGAPQPLGVGELPAVDMSLNGVAYAAWTGAGDVRLARLDRKATSFTALPAPADLEPAREAGTGTGRPRVAVSADGTALVVFGEGDRVVARRVFGLEVSRAPQDLTLPALEGRPGGAATLPEADIEDDSSYAWVTYTQAFSDGGTVKRRAIARRLRGSAFEEPVVVDGLAWGDGRSAGASRVEMSGRGEGLATTSTEGGVAVAQLKDNTFFAPRLLPGALTAGGAAETLDRFAGLAGGGQVSAVLFDDRADRRTEPSATPAQVVSNPAFGPVDETAGLDVAVDRAGDASLVFVQGTGEGRRLVHATFDRPPGGFLAQSSSKWRRSVRPRLVFSESFELWGPIQYVVEVDGQPVGGGTGTSVTPSADLPDGVHQWRVVATDRRGQVTATKTRLLRIDSTPPRLEVALRRSKGRVVRAALRASDAAGPGVQVSGVARVRVDWGDGSTTTTRSGSATLTHRFRGSGPYTVRVSATDGAGGVVVEREQVRPRT